MTNQFTVKLSGVEMDALISNLDGLIYSLGFDQDEELNKLYDRLVELKNSYIEQTRLQ